MFWRDPYRRRVRRLMTDEYSLVAERLRMSSLRSDPLAAADRLAKLRESLKPDEQTLLILRVDKGLSWKEIAQILAEDTPPDVGALRKRFERLKERLVRMAEKEGLIEPRQR
jgi:RNA polymerase sigma-70 factor (ECF subfamily)